MKYRELKPLVEDAVKRMQIDGKFDQVGLRAVELMLAFEIFGTLDSIDITLKSLAGTYAELLEIQKRKTNGGK